MIRKPNFKEKYMFSVILSPPPISEDEPHRSVSATEIRQPGRVRSQKEKMSSQTLWRLYGHRMKEEISFPISDQNKHTL